jgi:hypothetical protein
VPDALHDKLVAAPRRTVPYLDRLPPTAHSEILAALDAYFEAKSAREAESEICMHTFARLDGRCLGCNNRVV